MTTLLRRDPRTMFPDLMDWFEQPFVTLRPHLAQPMPVEDFIEDDHHMVPAELAGIEPAKDLEVTVGAGYLTIRAEKTDKTEGKHRSEFRYVSFSRTPSLPSTTDEDTVSAAYQACQILTKALSPHALRPDEAR